MTNTRTKENRIKELYKISKENLLNIVRRSHRISDFRQASKADLVGTILRDEGYYRKIKSTS